MRLRNQIFWAVAVIGVILDQLTKWWVVQTFALGDHDPFVVRGVSLHLCHQQRGGV
jgi:signal peptidase II